PRDGDPDRRVERERRSEVRLQGASRTRVELVERVRCETDEQRTRDAPRGDQADRGYPEQLQNAGRAAAAQVRAEAALRTAPNVVGEPERRDRGDGGAPDDSALPTDQRQPQATEVDPTRAAGAVHVAQLSRTGGVTAAAVASGRAE